MPLVEQLALNLLKGSRSQLEDSSFVMDRSLRLRSGNSFRNLLSYKNSCEKLQRLGNKEFGSFLSNSRHPDLQIIRRGNR